MHAHTHTHTHTHTHSHILSHSLILYVCVCVCVFILKDNLLPLLLVNCLHCCCFQTDSSQTCSMWDSLCLCGNLLVSCYMIGCKLSATWEFLLFRFCVLISRTQPAMWHYTRLNPYIWVFFWGGGGGEFLLFAHLLNRWAVLGSYCVTVKSLRMAMGIGTTQKSGAWKHLNKGKLLFDSMSALMLYIGRAVSLIEICVVWQNCMPFWAHFLWKMALHLLSSLLSLLWFYCLCWDCPQWKRWIIFTGEKLSVTVTLPYLMVDVCVCVQTLPAWFCCCF